MGMSVAPTCLPTPRATHKPLGSGDTAGPGGPGLPSPPVPELGDKPRSPGTRYPNSTRPKGRVEPQSPDAMDLPGGSSLQPDLTTPCYHGEN